MAPLSGSAPASLITMAPPLSGTVTPTRPRRTRARPFRVSPRASQALAATGISRSESESHVTVMHWHWQLGSCLSGTGTGTSATERSPLALARTATGTEWAPASQPRPGQSRSAAEVGCKRRGQGALTRQLGDSDPACRCRARKGNFKLTRNWDPGPGPGLQAPGSVSRGCQWPPA